ncbi:Bromodomain-containing protein, partial [Fomitiporia mediterranea MF3/22]|uniref:Bromodomain-containing protein n=1 Tax=Fomitiporia mediterranea (strain MF3/22) TaxID=694068 RepID=UPI000440991C
MVKREFAANPDIDVDAPRAKRHRETVAETPVTDEADMPEKDGSSERENDNDTNAAEVGPAMSPEEVREEGLKVLQVLRDAVDREGRQISYDFLRLVSKRQFPDYYEIIKQPIALDDIKAQLESHAYPSLEALRQDLDTCFKNAKRYNQRESRIWKDAKHLQKLANKEIDKILRRGDEDDDGSDKEGGKKKEKGTNIHRLMKNRLQKLLGKTDEAGRQLSPAFMDLPSKKKWAVYYKLIARPICIEDIFKRIKRKGYTTIQDFMSDVDLVFSNALQFNEEHSLIWEDALTLKTYFHQIMNDLPAKYNMNRADESSASPEVSHNRIKLKLPGHQSAAHANNTDAGQNGETSSGTMRIRVPGL